MSLNYLSRMWPNSWSNVQMWLFIWQQRLSRKRVTQIHLIFKGAHYTKYFHKYPINFIISKIFSLDQFYWYMIFIPSRVCGRIYPTRRIYPTHRGRYCHSRRRQSCFIVTFKLHLLLLDQSLLLIDSCLVQMKNYT